MNTNRRGFMRGVIAASAAVAWTPVCTLGNEGNQMYGLIGKINTNSGQRDALIAILLEGTDKMPGCLSYIVAKDPADENAIWITEVWDSKTSHEASLKLPSVQRAIARGKPLIAGFGSHTVTEPVGGYGLPSPQD